jgi:glutathione synthase/RimK-type ligase-like ATP-grasp enzyme
VRAALPFVVVGNPENRRVGLFQEALAEEGLPPARVVAWRELLARGAEAAFAGAGAPGEALVRIDSFGEDLAVERALLRRGYAAARDEGCWAMAPAEIDALTDGREEHGRVRAPRQLHLGFLSALNEVAAALAARPGWRCLNAPAEIAELFDKRVTSRRFAAAGIPVPPSLPGGAEARTPDALREAVARAGARGIFVKLASGSSASCLGLYRPRRGEAPEHLITSMELTPRGLIYNSLRVRRYTARGAIDAAVGFLLREGSQVELELPKARLDGHFFDTRALVVAGEPAFRVVRESRLPITNLHLGGRRGDPAAFEALVPRAVRDAADESCRRIARLYPGLLHIGVDVLYTDDLAGHAVVEANAFGDLLPNLSRDGMSVYRWEIRAAARAT